MSHEVKAPSTRLCSAWGVRVHGLNCLGGGFCDGAQIYGNIAICPMGSRTSPNCVKLGDRAEGVQYLLNSNLRGFVEAIN